jgi:hypothetical protein
MQKNSGLIVAAIVMVAIAAFTVWRSHARRAERSQVTVKSPQESSANIFDLLAPTGPHIRHVSQSEVDTITAQRGPDELCNLIGLPGNGLDDESLKATEIALMNQPRLSENCVYSVLYRLDNALLKKAVAHLQNRPYHEKEDELAITILKQHPAEVAAILRTQFALGTDHPGSNVLIILTTLRQHDSCGDIASSVLAMRQQKRLLTSDFSDAYNKLCRVR